MIILVFKTFLISNSREKVATWNILNNQVWRPFSIGNYRGEIGGQLEFAETIKLARKRPNYPTTQLPYHPNDSFRSLRTLSC